MNSKKESAKKTPAGSVAPTSAAPSPAARAPLKLSIPPILLEGDPDPSTYRKVAPKIVPSIVAEVPKAVVAEPAKEPVVAPVKGVNRSDPETLSLGELRLLARDPYTLFVQWDFPAEAT